MIPQNMLNAYASGPASPNNGQFSAGDLVAVFPGCDKDGRNCAKDQQKFFEALEKANN